MVSRTTYKAVVQAHKQASKDKKVIKIVRLTKSGQPSKMAEDTVGFDTMEQAEAYMERVAKLNPNRNFQWQVV